MHDPSTLADSLGRHERLDLDPGRTRRAPREFADVYGGRTVLVTGADGFMGSHLTDALVELGANVHAFVRATSSGALNNIGHLRNRLKVHFADLTDKTSIDYLVRELRDTAPDKPYVFHLGAQAHVGESWHRPYETVMANTVGTLNLLQSIVDRELELEKFDTAGTSEEYGNVREAVAHHHDFDDAGGLILHERSPINPKSIYATAKVAADFLTMNYHDAFGVPGVVTRMFNNYGPRQNPRYVTGTIITQALDAPEGRARRARAAARLLLLHRRRPRPPDGRRARASRRRLRLRPGREHLDGRLGRPDPPHRRRARLLARRPRGRRRAQRASGPGASDVMALRVGYEKLHRETGWEPLVSWEEGVLRTIRGTPRTASAGSAASTGCRPARPSDDVSSILVTGGGGFLGSHLVERLEADGHDVVAARRRDYDLTSMEDAARLFDDARPELVFHLAAEVGGIGANRANPGRYWYANLIMGAHVLEQSRLHEAASSCSPAPSAPIPKHTPVPFREDDLWNGYPEETNAPYGVAKKALLVGARPTARSTA